MAYRPIITFARLPESKDVITVKPKGHCWKCCILSLYLNLTSVFSLSHLFAVIPLTQHLIYFLFILTSNTFFNYLTSLCRSLSYVISLFNFSSFSLIIQPLFKLLFIPTFGPTSFYLILSPFTWSHPFSRLLSFQPIQTILSVFHPLTCFMYISYFLTYLLSTTTLGKLPDTLTRVLSFWPSDLPLYLTLSSVFFPYHRHHSLQVFYMFHLLYSLNGNEYIITINVHR